MTLTKRGLRRSDTWQKNGIWLSGCMDGWWWLGSRTAPGNRCTSAWLSLSPHFTCLLISATLVIVSPILHHPTVVECFNPPLSPCFLPHGGSRSLIPLLFCCAGRLAGWLLLQLAAMDDGGGGSSQPRYDLGRSFTIRRRGASEIGLVGGFGCSLYAGGR